MAGARTYKKLCSLSVFHRYHLDQGSTIFNDSPSLLEEQLKNYRVHDFLQIAPFNIHESILKGQKLFFKKTNTGFDLFLQAEKKSPTSNRYISSRGLDKNLYLGFTIKILDPLFENYSTVGASGDTPFYFTNKRPSTESNTLPFIDVNDITSIESYRCKTATYDNLLTQLTPNETRGLFGVIYLQMRGTNTVPVDGSNRSMLRNNNDLVETPPSYSIHLENRNTIWNYRDAASGNLLHSSDPTTLPIVKRGIVGYNFDGEERPGARPDRLLFEKDNNGNILKTISEIYI